ncbi:MAG: protein-glutamine glutaminase family protein [Bdellovibrio sp.]
MRYTDLGLDECERQIKKQYARMPFMEPEELLRRLQANAKLNKQLTIVPKSQLAELTSKIKSLPVSFSYDMNGCAGRAELISFYLQSRENIRAMNLHLGGHLQVISRHIPLDQAKISWGFHVAPFILVRETDNKLQYYSLDLTLLGEPRPLLEWLKLTTQNSDNLVALSVLAGFQTSPLEIDEEIQRGWTPTQTSLLEAKMKEPTPAVVHKASPLRLDLAPAFEAELRQRLFKVTRPFEKDLELDRPHQLLTQAYGADVINRISRTVQTNLRCEPSGASKQLCGIFFRLGPQEFCDLMLEQDERSGQFLPSQDQRLNCYQF